MEIKKLCADVFFSIFINEQDNSSIKRRSQKKILKYMKKMGVMELGYYDVTRKNKWIFSELISRLNYVIKKRLDNLRILSIQECCISVSAILSTCSFAIFDPDALGKNSKILADGIRILSQNSGEKPKGIEIQEKIGMLKEALNLIYFETQNQNKNCQNNVTEEDFIDLLELEISTILIFELEKSLRINKNCVIHFEEVPIHIYSEQLENVNNVLERMLTVKESLYGEAANDIMELFKREKGFNDKSLFLLCSEFGSNDETISLSLRNMRTLIKEKLCLNDTQLDFFVSIMFLNYKNKSHDEIIRNVNYSLFTTPFVTDIEGTVWVNKSNLCEAAKYLRRRVINEDVPLPRNVKNIIKEKINEKVLPIIKKELQARGFECFTNIDLAKDVVLKKLFYGIKNTPHEIDLYYINNDVLKIYDLKNYLIPLSVKESVIRIGNSIAKETIKLHNLNNILENNHRLIEERLSLHFSSIEYAILLTTDCYYADKYEDIPVIYVDNFLRMLSDKNT